MSIVRALAPLSRAPAACCCIATATTGGKGCDSHQLERQSGRCYPGKCQVSTGSMSIVLPNEAWSFLLSLQCFGKRSMWLKSFWYSAQTYLLGITVCDTGRVHVTATQETCCFGWQIRCDTTWQLGSVGKLASRWFPRRQQYASKHCFQATLNEQLQANNGLTVNILVSLYFGIIAHWCSPRMYRLHPLCARPHSQVGDVVCEIELEQFSVGVKVETPGFLAEICKSR